MSTKSKSSVFYALWRADFRSFFEKVFEQTNPGKKLQPGWHIDAMIYAAVQVASGKQPRQAIALPPGYLKSLIFSVALPAWLLGRDPTKRIICASHSMDLTERNMLLYREIIEAPWYRATFPDFKVSRKCDKAEQIQTTRLGYRLSASVGTSVTGFRADIIIIDDPLPADQALSLAHRNRVINWYDLSIESRLDDRERGAIIIVMQRLHLDDLIGHVLRKDEPWALLALPAIAEFDQNVQIGEGEFHQRLAGDVLCPTRESRQFLERKRTENSFVFAAQYQQAPIPPEGALIKRAWFRRYQKAPSRDAFDSVVQSWDCAGSARTGSDFSVGLCFGIRGQDFYLLDMARGRWEFPDLKHAVITFSRKHRADAVLVENSALGMALIHDLSRRSDLLNVIGIPVRPGYDKVTRLQHQSAKIESGRLYLPRSAPWLPEVEEELLSFPGSRHDDIVDALSQFMMWEHLRNPPELNMTVTFIEMGQRRRLVQYS